MGGAFALNSETDKLTKVVSGETCGRKPLRRQRIDEWLILKCILTRLCRREGEFCVVMNECSYNNNNNNL